MKPIYLQFNSISNEIDHVIRPFSVRLDLIGSFISCEEDKCKIGGGAYINSILGIWLVTETYEEVKALVLDGCDRQLKG